jgi:hypothetical protein
MANDYTLTQAELTKLRGNLTRAKNSKDPKKVIRVCDAALARFEEVGFPDCWSNWERAKQDAEFEIQRSSSRW